MSRSAHHDNADWENEAWSDADGPESDDSVDDAPDDADVARFGDSDGSVDTLPCPNCRREIYDQTDYCPHCGAAIVLKAASRPRALWIVLVLALAGAFAWLALR